MSSPSPSRIRDERADALPALGGQPTKGTRKSVVGAVRVESPADTEQLRRIQLAKLFDELELANHETAIDPAFMRRLAFHVRVPIPDAREREGLWRAMLPAQAAQADNLDFGRLAEEFEMSGGYIKNAVLRAAFLSADEGSPITTAHLIRGARNEYEAMGNVSCQPVVPARGWKPV